jgi:RNA polymerase sigma-70 factor, ECF subfamily
MDSVLAYRFGLKQFPSDCDRAKLGFSVNQTGFEPQFAALVPALMWKKKKPAAPPVSSSGQESCALERGSEDAQLSERERVKTSVSSVALNYGLPAVGLQSKAAIVDAARELTDAEVMLRVKAGDDSAFNFLVQKYRRPIINFMYRMARNPGAAEDLAQEVFLRVYRSRANYEASAKFTTWLYRIATNLGMNYVRDTRHERSENTTNLDEPDEETGQTPDLADKTLNVEERILRRERLEAIREKIAALPERQRMAVLMHKYQEMDYRQIAEVLKLSESATKSLLFRAYETLRTQLKEFL